MKCWVTAPESRFDLEFALLSVRCFAHSLHVCLGFLRVLWLGYSELPQDLNHWVNVCVQWTVCAFHPGYIFLPLV